LLKILFCCPVLDIRYEWFIGFLEIHKELESHHDWDVTYMFPYRKPVQIADTSAVRKAIKEDFDYILRMDDDVWDIPYGSVEQLMKADKDAISAVMYCNGFPYQRCAGVKEEIAKNMTLMELTKYKEEPYVHELDKLGVQPVDLTAFPFILFKVSMFKVIPEPWFVGDEDAPTDSYFCQKMADYGFQPYVDMGIQVNHRGITHLNRKSRYIEDMNKYLLTGQYDGNDALHKKFMALYEKMRAEDKTKKGEVKDECIFSPEVS